ncbi:GbsR/MarR family transcriptional regulator [Streptomyces cacaoi]
MTEAAGHTPHHHEGAPAEDTGEQTPQDYETRVSPFVEQFAADLTEAGMQRMAARVFACLLASDDGALTSAELSERLRASPAAVSGAVRYLAQVNLISRRRDPGSRRERYLLHQEVWFTAVAGRDNVLGRLRNTMHTGLGELGPDTPAGQRLGEAVEFFEFLQRELDQVLVRWRAHRSGRSR